MADDVSRRAPDAQRLILASLLVAAAAGQRRERGGQDD